MINLLFCGNKKIFDGLLIAALSAAKYTKSDSLNIYVYTMGLTKINPEFLAIEKKDCEFIEKEIQKYNPNNKITLIDLTDMFLKEMESSANLNSQYTPYIFLRLFASKVEGMPDKLLYLDADTMVLRDLNELYSIDISKYELAMARDYMGKVFKHPNYCNSGVILMNLKKIKETKLFDKCLVLVHEKKLPYPDQDAINKLQTKRLIISSKFNAQRLANDKTVIKHFCKAINWIPWYIYNIKPWMVKEVKIRYKTKRFDEVLDEYQDIIAKRKGEK